MIKKVGGLEGNTPLGDNFVYGGSDELGVLEHVLEDVADVLIPVLAFGFGELGEVKCCIGDAVGFLGERGGAAGMGKVLKPEVAAEFIEGVLAGRREG